ncbi:MAG: pitrilysin family protein [Bacillota bacterium]|nr:pitrilysin family protein [Bacillota bacterium]
MQTQTLPSGLVVIAKEMRHAPVAAFSVWYRVGGRNEVPGITGISHWAEHMMFKGTERFGKGALDRLVTSRGGEWNGFTTEDFTAYYEVLPSEHIGIAVDIEADRMANSLFSPSEIDSERSVIISEREGAENQPVFWLTETAQAVCWAVHPYRQGVIGAKCDLQAITREDLWAHYRAYYSPDNAVVVASGDFAATDLFSLVERSFGAIPRGSPRRPLRSVEPPQEGPRRLTVRRPGPAPYLLLLHHVPGVAHPDIPALLCLQAALAGAQSPVAWLGRRMGKSSRLYRRLVQSGLAVRVQTAVDLRADPSVFETLVTACPDTDAGALEEAIGTELGDIGANGIAPGELTTAKQQLRAQIAYSRAGVLGHATWLGMFTMIADTGLAETFEQAIAAVGRDDVQRVARQYLVPNNSTTGWFLPADPGEDRARTKDSRPQAEAQAPEPDSRDRRSGFSGWKAPGGPPPEGTSAAPRPVRGLPGPSDIARLRLENGMVLLACSNSAAEHVELTMHMAAGSACETPETGGLANFAARGTLLGTADRPFEVINEQLDALGASLAADCGPDAARWRGSCLSGDLPAVADLLAETLDRPSFPAEHVERLRLELATRIRERDQDTRELAQRTALELAYPGGHPYGRHPLGLLESLTRLGPQDLRDFHSRCYGPERTVVAAVGPLASDRLLYMVSKAFGGWRTQAAPAGPPPTAGDMAAPVRRDLHLQGKTQSDVAMALPALARGDPDYENLAVLNLILGRLGLGGRLGQRVREDLGLAYYCFSGLAERIGRGPWVLLAGVNPANVELAITTIREELDRIRREPVTLEELETALGFARGSLFLEVESASGLARLLVRMEVHQLGLDYLHSYTQSLASVTPQALLQVSRRCLDPGRLALVVAGPPPGGDLP